MLLTPKNIEFYATFLHSSVDIQERVIHFGSGVDGEVLMEVPIGVIDPHTTIVITLGLNKTHLNTASGDSDPIVGISDGINENLFIIRDAANYLAWSPCHPLPGTHDDNRVASTTPVSSTFKLTFTPFNKFGFCETAQEGGYINTGIFHSQIVITKPLFLTLKRENAAEEYNFHYFNVETY